MTLSVKVHGFEHDGMIPREFSCEGSDASPEISIAGVPEKAKSLALIVDDPDAPIGTFTHWLLYNLSPDTKTINKNAGKSSHESYAHGKNDFGKKGYGGPCPPRGHGVHRYFFTVYALDIPPSVKDGLDRKGLIKEIEKHIIEKAQYMGKYERK